MSGPGPCSVGISLGQDCHKTNYCRGVGTHKLSEFDEHTQKIIMMRGQLVGDVDSLTLCFHHKQSIVNRFPNSQKHCCNIFEIHDPSKPIKGSIILTSMYTNVKSLFFHGVTVKTKMKRYLFN